MTSWMAVIHFFLSSGDLARTGNILPLADATINSVAAAQSWSSAPCSSEISPRLPLAPVAPPARAPTRSKSAERSPRRSGPRARHAARKKHCKVEGLRRRRGALDEVPASRPRSTETEPVLDDFCGVGPLAASAASTQRLIRVDRKVSSTRESGTRVSCSGRRAGTSASCRPSRRPCRGLFCPNSRRRARPRTGGPPSFVGV